METIIAPPLAHETNRAQAALHELAERTARAVREDGSAEPLKGLHLIRASAPKGPVHSVYDPVFCVIAQRSKEIFLGDQHYEYDPAHYLLVTAELLLVGAVSQPPEARDTHHHR